MKTWIISIVGILLHSFNLANGVTAAEKSLSTSSATVIVLASPDLYSLTTQWVNEYCKLNPGQTLRVVKSTNHNIAAMLNTGSGIGFISDGVYKTLNVQQSWNVVVGRNVIVPVMNVKNPLSDEIRRKGITSQGIARIINNNENPDWGMILENGKSTPLHIYSCEDESIKTGLAIFTGNNNLQLTGIKTANGAELISSVQKDPDALGFCKLIDIIDLDKRGMLDNIKLVPIDKNGNGKIDYMEDIYSNLDDFSRGVWIGKYPKSLTGNIYSISSIKPTNQNEAAFLNWVLTDGQLLLSGNGFCDLVTSERQTQLAKINSPAPQITTTPNDSYAIIRTVLLILAAFALIGLLFDVLSRPFRNKKGAVDQHLSTTPAAFNEESVIVPKGLYFDKTHTWTFMEKDGSVKIGIDDFLQHITGPLSRIGMKPAGVKIKKGDPLLTIIQKGKQLIIYSPVSGTITEYNKTLITDSSSLNAAPYTDGWVYKIEPANWLREIQFLSMADNYKTWLKDEFARLKDFFATVMNAQTPDFAIITMQDGGDLKDSILSDFGPEVWEDFQTKFINNAR